MVSSLTSAFCPAPLTVNKPKLPEEHPRVQEVRTIAGHLGVDMPGAVVAGASPTFFAYDGPFVTADHPTKFAFRPSPGPDPPKHRGFGVPSGQGSRSVLVGLSRRDAQEFLLHKDYTDNWRREMKETFGF